VSAVVDAPAEAALDTCWYVYGIVPAESPDPSALGWPAVGGDGEVEMIEQGPLAAIVSPVSSADFDHPGIDEHLQQPEWLEANVRAHEQVVELVLAGSSVLPLRFCTIYRSQDAVRRLLADNRGELEEALARVAGKVERGVKIFCDRDRLTAAVAHGASSPVREGSGGRAYLERRLAEQQSAEQVEEVASNAVHDCHARLSAAADEGTLLRPQTREQSGRRDDMVMNAAYLVSRESRDLEATLAALRPEYEPMGFAFELTGPWPPYSFVPTEIE